MRIRLISVLLVLAFMAAAGYAQDTSKSTYRKVSQNAFGLGERLDFEISYGFLTAGNVVMEVAPNYITINGRNCYDISLRVNSAASFEWVYKISDMYKCYLDAEGLFPWKFEQYIREGDYTKDFVAIFDHENLKVNTSTTVRGEKKPDGEYAIKKYVLDVISAFYFARTQNIASMNKGDEFTMNSFYNDASYDLTVKILDRDNADVSAGEFRSVIVQPLVKEGVLIKKAENIAVWISDDDRKIPVKVQLDVIIGSVKAELTSYKNLSGPLNSKVK
ncbi:MAG TPA: DUF3108 domain-containing protein [Ignavibacteria bacterium]|nr:DUF3108 domain-containing protein [Ignavibacteria bacterium]